MVINIFKFLGHYNLPNLNIRIFKKMILLVIFKHDYRTRPQPTKKKKKVVGALTEECLAKIGC